MLLPGTVGFLPCRTADNLIQCSQSHEGEAAMTFLEKIRRFFAMQDLTKGSPMKGLISFSVPLLVGNFVQQLYNTVDSAVVGTYIGDAALAAVGASGPILNLLIVLFMGVATGASIITAQVFGAKNRQELGRVVGSTIFLLAVSGAMMMAVGYFLSPALIAMVAPPPEVAEGAVTYLQIIFLGIMGAAAYNILSLVLRGMGDSFYPLVFLVTASLINIVLDILFVSQFGMGIGGVALATVIAQMVSGILCLVRLIRLRGMMDLTWRSLRPDFRILVKIFQLGTPAAVSQVIFSLSGIVVQGLILSMGTAVAAASVAVMRVDGFCMMPTFTYGSASTTFTAQNLGARQFHRVQEGTRVMLRLAMCTSAVLIGLVLFFGRNLLELFTQTPEVVSIGVRGLRWLAAGYLVFGISQVLRGVMSGAGETRIPMYIAMVNILVFRLPLAYLFIALTRSPACPHGVPDAIFSSLMINWVMGGVVTVLVYRYGKWRRRLTPAGWEDRQADGPGEGKAGPGVE